MLRKLLKKYRKSSTEESLPLELCTSSQLTQQHKPLPTQVRCGLQPAGNDVVCTGWLEKSPPEKKLERYAWRKRWFILRNGQISGDPDVLEYYKNQHSKKPLRVINLNFCNQLGVGVTFNKKELQKSFMFDNKTNERTFYLVDETEADMNRWVQSICQICGFSQTKGKGSTDALRTLPSVSHSHHSSPAEFSSSSQHLFPARRSLALSHSSQLPLSSHIQPALSTSAPQECQHLHQCISGTTESTRNASFSQSTQQERDTAAQKLAQGNRHCINRVSSPVHDFCSLPKPSQCSGFDLSHSLSSHSHTNGSLTVSVADSEDVYTHKAHRNTLCREFGELPVDSAIAPPPQLPKTPWCGNPQQRPRVSDSNYPTRGRKTACLCAKSPNNTIMGQSDNASFSQSKLQKSDLAAQKHAQGNRHSINRVSSQVLGFCSFPKPSQYSGFDLTHSLASHSHTKGSLIGSAADSEDVYTFKESRNTPCREFGDSTEVSAIAPLPQHPKKPWCGNPKQRPRVSNYKYPTQGGKTACLRAKSPNNPIVSQSDKASFSQSNLQESDTATQELAQGNGHSINRVISQVHDFYSLTKTSQYSGLDLSLSLASHSHTKGSLTVPLADSEDVYTFKAPRTTPCREFGDLPVDSAIAPPPQHPKTPSGASSQQRPPVNEYKYPTRVRETAYWCAKSPEKVILGLSDNASSDDNSLPINPGSDIPMGTMPHHIASRGREIQPPPLYHHLKPGGKAKPELLDLINNNVINELPFKSPVTKSWSTFNHTFDPSSSQYCRSISITDSGDSEENCVPMQNPMSSSPVPSGTNNPAPKKSTCNVNYIDPDFQPPSPSPQHKPSTSSVISDEKGEYVQIDEEKNQALQKSIQESTKMRQA